MRIENAFPKEECPYCKKNALNQIENTSYYECENCKSYCKINWINKPTNEI